MAQNLSALTLVLPSGDPAPAEGGTFTLEASKTFAGGGGVNVYDTRAEFSTNDIDWSIIASTGDLATATTNPQLAQTDTANDSWTITANTTGTYYVRVTGDGNGGNNSYTIVTSSQQVTVTAGSVDVAAGAGAVTIQGQAPTVATLLELASADAAQATGTEADLSEKTIASLDPASITGTDAYTELTGPVQGDTANPAAAAIVVAGQAPTVQSILQASPEAATVTVVGQPVALASQATVQPDAGAVTVAGQAPAVGSEATTSPDAGAVGVVGQQPSLALTYELAVPAGAITVAGQQPTVASWATVQAGAGAIAVAGQAPTVQSLALREPAAAAVDVAGQQPSLAVLVELGIAAGAGAIAVAGQQPAVSTGSDIIATVTPDAAAITVAGQAATAVSTAHRAPGAAAIAVAGQQPSIDAIAALVPSEAAIAVQGQAPTVFSEAITQPAAAALALDPAAPTVTSLQVLEPGVGVVTLAGQAPTLTLQAELTLAPAAAAIAVAGQLADVITDDVVVKQASDAAVLQGLEVDLSEKYIASLDAAQLAGADLRTDYIYRPELAAIVLEGQVPVVLRLAGVITPAYADIRMNQGDETRPFVNTLGDNAKFSSDTAGITGTEWPWEEKTVSTYDEAELGDAVLPVTQEIWTFDDAIATTPDIGYPFNGVRPAWAEILVEGQQPAVEIAGQAAKSPNFASVTLIGGAVTVLSTAQVTPDPAEVVTIGETPDVIGALVAPAAAGITVAGLQPSWSIGQAIAASDAAGVTATDTVRFLGSLLEVDTHPAAGEIQLAGLRPEVVAALYIQAAQPAMVSVHGLIATITASVDWHPAISATATWTDEAGDVQTWTDVGRGSGNWSSS